MGFGKLLESVLVSSKLRTQSIQNLGYAWISRLIEREEMWGERTRQFFKMSYQPWWIQKYVKFIL